MRTYEDIFVLFEKANYKNNSNFYINQKSIQLHIKYDQIEIYFCGMRRIEYVNTIGFDDADKLVWELKHLNPDAGICFK